MADAGDSEHRRVQAVYDGYRRDGAHTRWDESQPGNAAILAERRRQVARILKAAPPPDRVLELGTGAGDVLAALPDGAPTRIGVDLLVDRLRDGRDRHPDLAFVQGDGAALPLPCRSVDLALSFTVFSSVLDDGVRLAIADELSRVVRPGGRLLWYDLRRRNPMNRQVRPVGRRELGRLFPGWAVEMRSTTVLPPLARRLGDRTERWYPRMARLTPLRTHLIGVLTRP